MQGKLPFVSVTSADVVKSAEERKQTKKRKLGVGEAFENRVIRRFQMKLGDTGTVSPVIVYEAIRVENPHVELEAVMEPCGSSGFTLLRQLRPVRRDLVRFFPNFLDKDLRDTLYSALAKHPAWKRYDREMGYGGKEETKIIQQPRYQIGFLKAGTVGSYTYSNFTLPTHPFPEALDRLDEQLRGQLGFECEFVLGNLYEAADTKTPIDPAKPHPELDDCIGEHSDREEDLDPTQSIISISLGDVRKFTLRLRKPIALPVWTPAQRTVVDLHLTHGSVLEMLPGCQSVLTHEVPRRNEREKLQMPATFAHGRINLTARKLRKR